MLFRSSMPILIILTALGSVNSIKMLDKLDFIVEKYKELEAAVSKPEIIGNQPLWQKYIKEMSDMEPIVKTYSSFKKHKQELSDAKKLLAGAGGDEEMKDLAKLEISGLEDEINKEEEQLKILLIPKDPRDEKNVILEIRADTGGEETALFGSNLRRQIGRASCRERV